MLRAAVVITAVFVVLSLLGGRDEVAVLSGTFASADRALLGLAYAAAYFAAVLLAPPLLISASVDRARSARARARPGG